MCYNAGAHWPTVSCVLSSQVCSGSAYTHNVSVSRISPPHVFSLFFFALYIRHPGATISSDLLPMPLLEGCLSFPRICPSSGLPQSNMVAKHTCQQSIVFSVLQLPHGHTMCSIGLICLSDSFYLLVTHHKASPG